MYSSNGQWRGHLHSKKRKGKKIWHPTFILEVNLKFWIQSQFLLNNLRNNYYETVLRHTVGMPCAMCAYVPYYTKYQNQSYKLRHTKRWEAVHQRDNAQNYNTSKSTTFKCSFLKAALLRHLKNIINIHKTTRMEKKRMIRSIGLLPIPMHTVHRYMLQVDIRCILWNLAPSL